MKERKKTVYSVVATALGYALLEPDGVRVREGGHPRALATYAFDALDADEVKHLYLEENNGKY